MNLGNDPYLNDWPPGDVELQIDVVGGSTERYMELQELLEFGTWLLKSFCKISDIYDLWQMTVCIAGWQKTLQNLFPLPSMS